MTSSTIVQTLARPFTDFSNLVRPLLHSERGISSEQGISSERARAIHQARRQSRGVGSADLDREDASEEEPLAKGDVEEEEGNVRVASASQPDASTTPAPKHLAEPASSKSAFSSSTYATASQSPSPSDSRPPWPFHSPSLSSLPNPFHHRPSSASSSLTDATSSRIPTPTPLTPTKKEHLRLSAIERQQHNPSPDLIETCPTPPSSGFRPASRQRNLLPSRFVKDDGGAGSFEEDSVESSDEEKQEELFLEDGDGENEWMREDYSSPDTPPLQFLASSLLTAAYDRPLPTNQRFPFHRHSNYASTPISTVHSRTSETTLFTYDLAHLPAPGTPRERRYRVRPASMVIPTRWLGGGRYSGMYGDPFGPIKRRAEAEPPRREQRKPRSVLRSWWENLRRRRQRGRGSEGGRTKEELDQWVAVVLMD